MKISIAHNLIKHGVNLSKEVMIELNGGSSFKHVSLDRGPEIEGLKLNGWKSIYTDEDSGFTVLEKKHSRCGKERKY